MTSKISVVPGPHVAGPGGDAYPGSGPSPSSHRSGRDAARNLLCRRRSVPEEALSEVVVERRKRRPQRATVGADEPQDVVRVAVGPPALLVQQPVMLRAQQAEIRSIGRAARRPRHDVVRVQGHGALAAGPPARDVPVSQLPFQGEGDRPVHPPDPDGPAVRPPGDELPAGLGPELLERRPADGRPALDVRRPEAETYGVAFSFPYEFPVHVDDDRRAVPVRLRGELHVGQRRQGVGAAGPVGLVLAGVRIPSGPLGPEPYRLFQGGSGGGREPPGQPELPAAVIPPHPQIAGPAGLVFLLAAHPAGAPGPPRQGGGRPVLRAGGPVRVRVGCGEVADGAHLVLREPALGHPLGRRRELLQGPGRPGPSPGGARRDAASVGDPLGHRAAAVVLPDPPPVELRGDPQLLAADGTFERIELVEGALEGAIGGVGVRGTHVRTLAAPTDRSGRRENGAPGPDARIGCLQP